MKLSEAIKASTLRHTWKQFFYISPEPVTPDNIKNIEGACPLGAAYLSLRPELQDNATNVKTSLLQEYGVESFDYIQRYINNRYENEVAFPVHAQIDNVTITFRNIREVTDWIIAVADYSEVSREYIVQVLELIGM